MDSLRRAFEISNVDMPASNALRAQCFFLTKLPSELRIKIYEDILRFTHPIKLRQIVSGSSNTNILRTNKRIYEEAVDVLYDINIVSVTRNDFCANTESRLKTPVNGQHIRHIRVTSFGESIVCTFLLHRCAVCEDQAIGFFATLTAMPKLRSAVVDYSTQTSSFLRLRKLAEDCPSEGTRILGVGVGVYRAVGGKFVPGQVECRFEHRGLAMIWPALRRLNSSVSSEQEEEDVLAGLRDFDPEIPDKVWLLFCARQYRRLAELASEQLVDAWARVESVGLPYRSSAWHDLTVAVQTYLAAQTAAQCRRYLRSLRELATV